MVLEFCFSSSNFFFDFSGYVFYCTWALIMFDFLFKQKMVWIEWNLKISYIFFYVVSIYFDTINSFGMFWMSRQIRMDAKDMKLKISQNFNYNLIHLFDFVSAAASIRCNRFGKRTEEAQATSTTLRTS